MIFIRKRGSGLFLKDSFETILEDSKKVPRIKDLVFNWGTVLSTRNPTINPPEIIKLISNKPRFRRELSGKEIRVPQTFYSVDSALSFLKSNPKQILIGRPRNHFGGKNFHILTNKSVQRDFVGQDYWSLYIPKTREYRVFTLMNRVLMVAEKIPENIKEYSWNHSHAHFVNTRWDNFPRLAIYWVLKANEVIKADFAAYDIIFGEDKHYYILEANSCPNIESDYRMRNLELGVNWIEDYYRKNGKFPAHFPALTEVNSYRDVLLPIILQNRENY